MSRKYTPTDRKILAELNAAKAVDYNKVTTVLNNNGGIAMDYEWERICGLMKMYFWIGRIPRIPQLSEKLTDLVQVGKDIGTDINVDIGR